MSGSVIDTRAQDSDKNNDSDDSASLMAIMIMTLVRRCSRHWGAPYSAGKSNDDAVGACAKRHDTSEDSAMCGYCPQGSSQQTVSRRHSSPEGVTR